MRPLLIDLDGVLRLGDQLAPGAREFLDLLEKEKNPACVLSNTTKLRAIQIRQFFQSNGIDMAIPILTALDTAIDFAHKFKSVDAYVHPDAAQYFQGLPRSEDPEAVIVGDMGAEWSYPVLNRIFRQIMGGAEIVAMQMNRFWQDGNQLVLDAGPFIAALEYATTRKSILVGKPSRIFFQRGLALAGAQEDEHFLMLGDDLQADIQAAQKMGGKGILITTGKTTDSQLKQSQTTPDFVVQDLSEMINLLPEII